MICKIDKDLSEHLDKFDEQDLLEEAIEAKAEKLFSQLKNGLFIMQDGELLHMEDILSCVDIEPYLLTECANGKPQKLTDFLTEQVYNKCYDIAEAEIR